VGANTEGTLGDEETGYAEHAGFDPRMEAEGPRKRLEEVAQRKGKEIDVSSQMYHIMNTVLFNSGNQVLTWLDWCIIK
jgi:hypothetical protein